LKTMQPHSKVTRFWAGAEVFWTPDCPIARQILQGIERRRRGMFSMRFTLPLPRIIMSHLLMNGY
jgi:hypothetical protein